MIAVGLAFLAWALCDYVFHLPPHFAALLVGFLFVGLGLLLDRR